MDNTGSKYNWYTKKQQNNKKQQQKTWNVFNTIEEWLISVGI